MFDKTKTIAWLVIGVIIISVASFILLNNKINKLTPVQETKELDEPAKQ